jgi:hypothetical protein
VNEAHSPIQVNAKRLLTREKARLGSIEETVINSGWDLPFGAHGRTHGRGRTHSRAAACKCLCSDHFAAIVSYGRGTTTSAALY